eukprot:CAMPEP_0119546716 /NCGR_PEP_ID=MMETSP1352-20130426/1012_1 /TAXON_ID=265584 /ORGANISM="Stauroneis constricta, Strain CCMP1120" /LENGTH=143 /DNA_ID=CAMNT_0007591441 /DNA_START=60 /DNA_END=491 /DNA_ORIENTATION=+
MSGETDIEKLIKGMKPILHDGTYVFVTIPTADLLDDTKPTPTLNQCIGTFRETEGTTLVLEQGVADQFKLECGNYKAAWITLSIHSSLEAVGLTAYFANLLAKASISCNVIAGYYHDHIFVDEDRAAEAMELLQSVAGGGGDS